MGNSISEQQMRAAEEHILTAFGGVPLHEIIFKDVDVKD